MNMKENQAGPGDPGHETKGRYLRMLGRTPLPSFYDLYQTLIAIIGMVGVNRILFELPWPRATGYAVVTVLAYWVGTGLVSLFQKPAKTSLD